MFHEGKKKENGRSESHQGIQGYDPAEVLERDLGLAEFGLNKFKCDVSYAAIRAVLSA